MRELRGRLIVSGVGWRLDIVNARILPVGCYYEEQDEQYVPLSTSSAQMAKSFAGTSSSLALSSPSTAARPSVDADDVLLFKPLASPFFKAVAAALRDRRKKGEESHW